MATFTRGQTFGTTETVTNTKLHALVDDASITSIVNADIDNAAAISDTKLDDITTGSKVSGKALFALPSIPSGAGLIPYANIPQSSVASIPNTDLLPITLASWVSGQSFKDLASVPTGAGQLYYSAMVQSLASGGLPIYDGANSFVGKDIQDISSRIEIFTSSGTWTAPLGVNQIVLWMVGGGGASGSNKNSASGGGGGGGACVLGIPVKVTASSSYTYTVGAGGTSGGAGSASTSPDGNDGADSIWDTGGLVITASGGSGGIGYGTPGVDGDGGAGGTGNSDMDGSGATGGSRYTAWSGGQGGGGRTADSNGAGGGATYFSDGPDKNVAVVANTGVGGASPTGNQQAGQAGSDGIIIIAY